MEKTENKEEITLVLEPNKVGLILDCLSLAVSQIGNKDEAASISILQLSVEIKDKLK